jgi:hypothetical protein
MIVNDSFDAGSQGYLWIVFCISDTLDKVDEFHFVAFACDAA